MTSDVMAAVHLTGHGGIEKLAYREDVPVPRPATGEVLVKVTATAKSNTDRKVRKGLCSTTRNQGAATFRIGSHPTLAFPRIQGAARLQHLRRRATGHQPDAGPLRPWQGRWLCGGRGRAGRSVLRGGEPGLADAELAVLGTCSCQTALHMLRVASVAPGEHVLVTGASGGVGTALIQLCRLIGAVPHAVSSPGKAAELIELGAESVVDRTTVSGPGSREATSASQGQAARLTLNARRAAGASAVRCPDRVSSGVMLDDG